MDILVFLFFIFYFYKKKTTCISELREHGFPTSP
jgi:hypothetical protein